MSKEHLEKGDAVYFVDYRGKQVGTVTAVWRTTVRVAVKVNGQKRYYKVDRFARDGEFLADWSGYGRREHIVYLDEKLADSKAREYFLKSKRHTLQTWLGNQATLEEVEQVLVIYEKSVHK